VNKSFRATLIQRHAAIPTPDNYYGGTPPFSGGLPRNVMIFNRSSFKQVGSGRSYHYRYVLILNLETSGVVMVDNMMLNFRPGQALLIFPYQFHHFLKLEKDTMSWLFITFELNVPETLAMLRNRQVSVGETVWHYVDHLTAAYGAAVHRGPRDSDRIVLLTAMILNELKGSVRQTVSARSLIKSGADNLGLLNRVNQYIYEKLDQPLTVAEVAGHVSISESHLRALYRRHAGIGLGACIREMKLCKAIGLIGNSEMNVSQIAFECGYDSLFAFSRAFKRRFGASPIRYRKKTRPGERAFPVRRDIRSVKR
jgi:AraC-like DNA-binding protein